MFEPLLISLRISLSAAMLAMLLGVPIAAALARWRGPLGSSLDALANLPLVLPPTVLGYYLLVLLGARSPIGNALSALGMPLVFTWQGAVIAAATVAVPLVIQSSRAAIEAVDHDLEDVARTLGRSEWGVFFSVTFPLARRGVIAGGVLAFSRALGEFGATLMVAGNIPGRTQTLPLAIYDAVQAGDQMRANLLALLLTITALALLLIIRRMSVGLEHESRPS